ncbi:MAG: type II secretion system F family protein [Gemmatimonadales bacterium]
MTRRYRYRAAQSDGRLRSGQLEAVTGAEAGALLVERGLQPVLIEPVPADQMAARAAPRRELAVTFRSIAALTGAGVPLDQAIAATEALSGPALRVALHQCGQRLRAGRTLAQALEADEGTVPPVVLGMLRAGERSGRLHPSLEQVATHLELEAELVSRIRHAFAYPAVLAVTGLASVVVIATVVVPKFATLLDELGQDLPLTTRLLLEGTGFIARYALPLCLGLVLLSSLAAAWARRPAGRRRWHEMLLAVPGLGPVRHGLATVRICRALGGCLHAGMPLLPSLDAAQEAAGDLAIAARVAAARERVGQGETLARTLGAQRALTAGALQLVAVGESSGQLELMLERAGDLALQETQRALSTLVSLLEPLLVIGLGGFVAFVAAALLQALYSLRPAA